MGFLRLLLLFVCCLLASCSPQAETSKVTEMPDRHGKPEVVYHMMQRSFYDSNGDSHGDLKGVTAQLDYLEDLGVTSILMTPLYKSIYYHNYFPEDFMEIDEEYGTVEDYQEMVEAIHKRGMKFYMDMEIHYVTDTHLWYKDSYENPASEYSKYIIYNGEGNTEPESIIFDIDKLEGYDGEVRGLTTIDLYHPPVRDYIYGLFHHWIDPNGDGNFDDGVDGYRIDHMMDDLDWKGIRTEMLVKFWAPLFRELKAINPDLMIVGEQADWQDLGTDYFTDGEIDALFAFKVHEAAMEFDPDSLARKTKMVWDATPAGGDQFVFIENHDTKRFASIVESDPDKLRLGAFYLLTTKGIPSIYYGQELGMTGEGGFGAYGSTDANDIPRREAFEWYASGEGEGMCLWYKDTGPWWDETNIKPNDGISLEEQRNDSLSLLNFYKELIELRNQNPALHKGDLQFVESNDDLLHFQRLHETDTLTILMNFSEKQIEVELGDTLEQQFQFGGVATSEVDGALQLGLPPYSAAVYK